MDRISVTQNKNFPQLKEGHWRKAQELPFPRMESLTFKMILTFFVLCFLSLKKMSPLKQEAARIPLFHSFAALKNFAPKSSKHEKKFCNFGFRQTAPRLPTADGSVVSLLPQMNFKFRRKC